MSTLKDRESAGSRLETVENPVIPPMRRGDLLHWFSDDGYGKSWSEHYGEVVKLQPDERNPGHFYVTTENGRWRQRSEPKTCIHKVEPVWVAWDGEKNVYETPAHPATCMMEWQERSKNPKWNTRMTHTRDMLDLEVDKGAEVITIPRPNRTGRKRRQ